MKIVLIPLHAPAPCAEVDFRYNEPLDLDAGDGKRSVNMVQGIRCTRIAYRTIDSEMSE